MGIHRFDVPSLSPCCAQRFQETLSQLFPKAKVHVCAINKQVEIEDTSPDEQTYFYYLRAIKQAGYSANWLPHWAKAIIGIFFGTICLILCLSPLSLMAMLVIGGASALLTLALGFESFLSAFRALKSSHRLNMDSLFVVSTFLAIVVSFASCFIPGLPMMFELGLLVFGFRQLGLAIEASTLRKIATISFQDLAPKVVQCFRAEQWQTVDVANIQAGEKIKVTKDSVLPLDGKVLTGVYGKETHKTGQIQARYFEKDTEISAGTEVSAEVEIEVSRLYEDSFLMVMHKALQSAVKTDSPLQIKIAKALTIFVPTILFLALLSGILVGLLVGLLPGLICAITVLICACPCILGLVTPLMIIVGMGKTAKVGIILKHQEALERAKDIDTVVFDLHGTLTEARPIASILYRYTDEKENDAILMAAMENAALSQTLQEEGQSSSQMIAKAIVEAIGSVEKRSIAVTIEQGGLSASYQEKTYYLGDATLMKAKGIEIDTNTSDLCFVENGLIKAYITVRDALRPDAKKVVSQLKAQGKRVCICTGAPTLTALHYAKQLGIAEADCFAECLPLMKQQKIEALQKAGYRIAMVGDGNNDAVVMKTSDLSIAILSDFTGQVTKNWASICVLQERFQSLPALFAIAEETLHGVYISLGVNITYNVFSVVLAGGVLLAAGILMPPVVGAVLMFVQVCAVLLGAYYMKQREVRLPTVEADVSMKMMGELSELRPITYNPSRDPQPTIRAASRDPQPTIRAATVRERVEPTYNPSHDRKRAGRTTEI